MQHQSNETLRKSLHIGFGLFALTLRWLPWWLAAGVAVSAVVSNWLVLHKIVGTTISRHERGWDGGIILYPLMVALLIVVFRDDLHIAGLAWATLAFGDGFATIVGKSLGGRRLPWNGDKTWSGFLGFIVFGFIGAYLVSWYLSDEPTWWPRWAIVLITVVAGGIAESLPLHVDDNITVPVASAIAAFTVVTAWDPQFHVDSIAMGWVTLNAMLAIAGYLLRTVDLSGMIGGFLLGAIIIVCASPKLYVVMLAFFVIGTLATKIGYGAKASAGLAQEKGGRRGFGHAFANIGVATLCAVAIAMNHGVLASNALLWWAAVASLATAGADTVASEIGSLIGQRAFLPTTFKRVPPGTEGAISIEGTLAGIVAALIISYLGVNALFTSVEELHLVFKPVLPRLTMPVILFIAACAAIGSYIESVAGNINRKYELGIANGALNFFNTLVGALLVLLIAPYLQWMDVP